MEINMKKIMLVIGLILITGLLINSGCVPTEPSESGGEGDEVSELEQMGEDMSSDNLGDIDKDISDAVNW